MEISLNLTRDEVMERARKMTKPGWAIPYKLGRGGMKPGSVTPGVSCDCSGFVAWCYGISRHLDHPLYREFNGGWLETTAVYRDATKIPGGMFDQIERYLALPGDVMVWPDGQAGVKGQGHIGIVSKVDKDGPVSVIHCSKGNYTDTGHAILETGTGIFDRHNAVIARPLWLESRRA